MTSVHVHVFVFQHARGQHTECSGTHMCPHVLSFKVSGSSSIECLIYEHILLKQCLIIEMHHSVLFFKKEKKICIVVMPVWKSIIYNVF